VAQNHFHLKSSHSQQVGTNDCKLKGEKVGHGVHTKFKENLSVGPKSVWWREAHTL